MSLPDLRSSRIEAFGCTGQAAHITTMRLPELRGALRVMAVQLAPYFGRTHAASFSRKRGPSALFS
jgi:hypothetical protein